MKLMPNLQRAQKRRPTPFAGLIKTALAVAVAATVAPTAGMSSGSDEHTPYSASFAGNFLAARFAGKRRDLSKASAYYLETLRADPDNSHLLDRTFALTLADGQLDTALELAQRISEKATSGPISRLALAVDDARKGDFAAVSDRLKPNALGPLERLTTGVLLGWAKHGSGDTSGAVKHLDSLTGPEWFAVFKAFHAGLMHSVAGRHDLAETYLAEAYRLDDNAMRTAVAYAIALAHRGRNEMAMETLADYMSRRGSHPMLTNAMETLKAGNRPALMIKSAQEGIGEILYSLGTAIRQDGGEEMSAIYLQLALHADPGSDLAKFELSEVYEKTKNYDRANALLASVQEGSAVKRSAEIQIALNYNALDQVDEARKHLRALVEKDPSDLVAIRALANLLRDRKIYTEAAEIYSMAVAAVDTPMKRHWTLFYYRGICYEQTKQWPLAEADFKKALDLFPDQPMVLNYLGYSWVDMGRNLDTALGMIKKAVDQRPNDGYIVDSLGWVYYKLGRMEDAVKELERAVELRPHDPVINDHLGDAYWQVGRKLEARFQWSHARDLKPEPKDLVRIKDKLENGLQDPVVDAAAVSKEDEK